MSKVVHPRMCDSKKTARRHVETKVGRERMRTAASKIGNWHVLFVH